ncbi:acyl carrier protein [Mycobacterium florentinum]|nr:acyl carrier protein [Mycobacterium florentinum]
MSAKGCERASSTPRPVNAGACAPRCANCGPPRGRREWHSSQLVTKASLALANRVRSLAMASSSSAVTTALQSILRDDLNVDMTRVTPEARLIDDVGLDSVAFAVGMVAIEERLGVALSEEELLTCDTVGDLDAAIAAKTS